MSYLFLFKRFEIWLLLGVVVGLLIFAFQPVPETEPVLSPPEMVETEPNAPGETVVETASPVVEESGLKITDVRVEATEQGQVVELTLLAQAKSEAPVPVDEATLTATTEEGVPVPYFFEPFRETQSLRPGEASLVTVRLWLAGPAESIWLDFQGERAKAELPRES